MELSDDPRAAGALRPEVLGLFFDQRLFLNAAYFYNIYTIQLSVFTSCQWPAPAELLR